MIEAKDIREAVDQFLGDHLNGDFPDQVEVDRNRFVEYVTDWINQAHLAETNARLTTVLKLVDNLQTIDYQGDICKSDVVDIIEATQKGGK